VQRGRLTAFVVDPDGARLDTRLTRLARAGIAATGETSLDDALDTVARGAFAVVETRLDLGPHAPCAGLEVAAEALRRGVERVVVVTGARAPGARIARRLGVHVLPRPPLPARLLGPPSTRAHR